MSGSGMTVCIAALANNRRSLVLATDEQVSAGYAASSRAIKLRWFHPNWAIMYAGDMGAMVSLLRRVKRSFPKTETPPVDEVSNVIVKAYQDELVKVKEQRYLKPSKLDWDTFHRNDPRLFTDAIYERMKSQLDETTISQDPNQAPTLLIAGFDADGPGHIFSVDHPGVECGHNLVGFHAIGTGFYYALTMLHSHSRYISHFDPSNLVLYRVAEAKFMAESDPQVGPSTTLIIWEVNTKPRLVFEKNIRKLWNRVGRPRIPQHVADKIQKIVETDSHPLELPVPVRLEQGFSNGATEVPEGLKDVIEKNSRVMLEFVTSISSD